jgi:hypothetical protein
MGTLKELKGIKSIELADYVNAHGLLDEPVFASNVLKRNEGLYALLAMDP